MSSKPTPFWAIVHIVKPGVKNPLDNLSPRHTRCDTCGFEALATAGFIVEVDGVKHFYQEHNDVSGYSSAYKVVKCTDPAAQLVEVMAS